MPQTGQALLSANWYRVAALKPRLRGHAHIHRHVYRGKVWYVIEDKVASKYHRFNPASYKVISLLDGRRNMQDLWTLIITDLADQTPSQDEIIALLGQLYNTDLIQCDVKPDLAELFLRRNQQRRRLWFSRFANPMSMRFPLIDPDAWLGRLVQALPFLGNRWGLLIWLLVVLPALVLAPSHWVDLTENFNEQLLTLDNLLMMVVVFPLIKALHELGHGLACKVRGGEVHEMGMMLLVFFPAPYVDASSASAMSNKWQRILVGAAGMLTEIFVAAVAFYFWLVFEPGFTRSIAYNIIVLASVTTVLFNANPLLRYDGYYMFADWLESPNFGQRASKYWQYLANRYLLGVKQTERPLVEPDEALWFTCYEPLAFGYRLFVVFSIALFVAQQYFFVGVIIGVWGLIASVLIPVYKNTRALFSGTATLYRGTRAGHTVGGLIAIITLLLFVVPLPNHTTAEGVLWPPENAILRTEANGFVDHLEAESGATLSRGQAVLVATDPEIQAKLNAQTAKVVEVQAEYDAAWGIDPAKALQLMESLHHESAALDRIKDEQNHLVMHSQADGLFLVQDPQDLPGRWLVKGDIIGYVQNDTVPRVRLVVDQDHVDQVRLNTEGVEIKLPQAMAQTWSARVMREVPAADKQLPSSALGQQGGGDFALDLQDEQGMQSLHTLFEFELQIADRIPHRYLGSRVYVRFEHPAEPIGFRILRSVRRLFLSQFLI